MPFTPELHYFYLYLKMHLEHKHDIDVSRADDQVLTVPLLDKIVERIQSADVIVADSTGRRANVFYELGIAHTLSKNVILMTSESISDVPSDIRHFEFIRYALDDHRNLLDRLDNALNNVFLERYENLYRRVELILEAFRQERQVDVRIVPRDEFIQRVIAGERIGQLPDPDDDFGTRHFLLPKIVENVYDSSIQQHMQSWLVSTTES